MSLSRDTEEIPWQGCLCGVGLYAPVHGIQQVLMCVEPLMGADDTRARPLILIA